MNIIKNNRLNSLIMRQGVSSVDDLYLAHLKQIRMNKTKSFISGFSKECGTSVYGSGFARLDWGAASLRGLCAKNEDTFIVGQPAGLPNCGVFAVFDGHGQGRYGAHVAKLASGYLARLIFNHHISLNIDSPSSESRVNKKDTLVKSFIEFDSLLSEISATCSSESLENWIECHHDHGMTGECPFGMLAQTFGSHKGIDFRRSGACAVVALVSPTTVTVANLGDCQAVADSGPLTKPHHTTDPKERNRIYINGGFVADERLNGYLVPTRAFGDFTFKTNDSPDKHILSCIPEITEYPREQLGEFIVLGSDGIFDVLSDSAVIKLCHNNAHHTVEKISEIIVDTAMCSGSLDNVTCVVIKLNNPNYKVEKQERQNSFDTSVTSSSEKAKEEDAKDVIPSIFRI